MCRYVCVVTQSEICRFDSIPCIFNETEVRRALYHKMGEDTNSCSTQRKEEEADLRSEWIRVARQHQRWEPPQR